MKKPKKHCTSCGHYHRIKPGEITYVGTFVDIEECRLGNEIGRYVADKCNDFWEV